MSSKELKQDSTFLVAKEELQNFMQIIANEEGVPIEEIQNVIEHVLTAVLLKQFKDNMDLKVQLNPKSGNCEVVRRWQVVADSITETDTVDSLTPEFNAELQIKFSQAQGEGYQGELDGFLEKPVKGISFGRIEAQLAKQLIRRELEEARVAKLVASYQEKIGKLINGTAVAVQREGIIVELYDKTEAMLYRKSTLPHEAIRVGDRVRACLHAIRQEGIGPKLLLSRICNEMLAELFKLEVPEVSEEVIQIKAVAREPGIRAKVAVKTNDGRIDPVGACIGMRGARVQAISNELGGERIDVILWDDNLAQFLINAMVPAEVLSIIIDEDHHAVDIAVSATQLSQAIGRDGQNIRLASMLTGWELNVMTVEELAEKEHRQSEVIILQFINTLKISRDLAEQLVTAGFSSLEEIAYVALEELMAASQLSAEAAEALQKNAQVKVQQSSQAIGALPEELLKLEGMNSEIVHILVDNKIASLEDLAELSVYDLLDLPELSGRVDRKLAETWIKKAREPWFE